LSTTSNYIVSNNFLGSGFALLNKNGGWLFGKLLFVLLFLISINGTSQNTSPYLKLNKEYVVSYFKEAGDIAVSPVKWKKRQWLGFAAATGITLITYSQDDVIRDYFQRNQTEAKDKISQYFLDPLGTYYLVGMLGGMYVYGLLAKDQKTETAALLTSKAVILTGAYTFLFKNLFQRQRPDQADPANPNYWGGPFDGFHNNSFPSGHTSVVFATATVLSAYYKDKIWVGITSFSLASLVALSRGYDDRHWASDAVAGAFLGYAIGRLVYTNFEKKNLNLKPFGNRHGQGITLSWNL
jgi:membrane-associated phospholipid phosphatase